MKIDELLFKLIDKEAQEWCRGKTLREAWDTCERGDWMLRFAAFLVDRKLLVRTACTCARHSLLCVPAGEPLPLQDIEAAEAWCRGEATEVDAWVYERVESGSWAAWAACWGTVSSGRSTKKRSVELQESADIVRSMIPFEEIEKGVEVIT